jgi:uncharacterized membrane protein
VTAPPSPTLVAGWVITIPKEDTIPLDLTVEEAIRFVVGAGVVSPDGEHPAGVAKAVTGSVVAVRES